MLFEKCTFNPKKCNKNPNNVTVSVCNFAPEISMYFKSSNTESIKNIDNI